jgi:hypothetical protein
VFPDLSPTLCPFLHTIDLVFVFFVVEYSALSARFVFVSSVFYSPRWSINNSLISPTYPISAAKTVLATRAAFIMEKYNQSQLDSEDSRSSGEYEKTSFLNRHFIKETRGGRGMLWLTLLNLFIFMLSAMTLVCAVFSQRSTSNHSAAQIMDQFGLTCKWFVYKMTGPTANVT